MCVRLCVCACMTPARPLTKSNCGGGGEGTRRLMFLPIDHDVCPASPRASVSPARSPHRTGARDNRSFFRKSLPIKAPPPSPLYPFLPFYAIPLHWTGERQGGGPTGAEPHCLEPVVTLDFHRQTQTEEGLLVT